MSFANEVIFHLGAGKYGQKSILDQAELFVGCSKEHPELYCPPKVNYFIFYFF